jgi:hypothetical protein
VRQQLSDPPRSDAAPILPDVGAAGRLWSIFDAEPLVRPPARPPGFRVLAPLAAGGQGSSWLAEREVDGVMVAIKFAVFATNVPPERLWSEIELLSRNRLSCVARLAGHGIADGHPWIATEYVDGEPLDAWAARHDRAAVVAMLAQVADALAVLHAAGLIHRDIKPANVVVDNADRPILIDLGLGASIDSALDRTIDGLPAGSPAFMSPEQARGERSAIGPASDIWSLGATAFLLLAGEPPHASAGSVAAQVARAGTEPPRRARSIAPNLPRAVAEVLDWAVQPRIDDRPSSAAALALALRAAAEGRSAVPGSGRRLWRRMSIIGGVAALLLGVVLPLVLQLPSGSAGGIEQSEVMEGPSVVGLSTGSAVMIAGDYPNSRFGSAVAVIGDLDGDYLDEVAIGAPDAPGRQPDGHYVELAGEVSIVRGSDVRASLASDAVRVVSPMHRIAGADVRGHAGASICSAGDMDGDSIEELAILADGPERQSGTVTIVRGSEVLRTASLAQCVADRQAIRIEGVSLGKLYSGMVHCDVDADGLEDLIIGCPGVAGPGGARAGGVMVVHGARTLFGPDSREPLVRQVAGPEGVFGFGVSLAAAWGPEGKRYVAIGAPLGERPGPGGTGCIVLLRSDAFAAGDRLRDPAFIASCGRPDEWFGLTVALVSNEPQDLQIHGIQMLGGGSGVANAANDGGMAELIGLTYDGNRGWKQDGRHSWRGLERTLGRGQQMGAAVAIRRNMCCNLEVAIASPCDAPEEVAAGSVMLVDPWSQFDRTSTYRGSKRAFAVGSDLAWWCEGYPPSRSDTVALLIGAPGEDSPSRQAATGAVWIVRSPAHPAPE